MHLRINEELEEIALSSLHFVACFSVQPVRPMLLNFSFRGRGLPSSPWAHAQLSPQNQHCSFGYRLSLPVAQMFLQAEDQKWERNAPFLRRLRSNGDAGHIKLSPCVGMRVVLNGSPGGCWRHWSWPDKWEIELQ